MVEQVVPKIYQERATALIVEQMPRDIFTVGDLQMELEVLPGQLLPFGACMRRSVWSRTKPVSLYQQNALTVRKAEFRKLVEEKDYELLRGALEKATLGGEAYPDSQIIDTTVDGLAIKINLPLIRQVNGKPTVVIVRSLAARAACSGAIYGSMKTPMQPQPRDLAAASLIIYALASLQLPWRGIEQMLVVYSDQALLNTAEYLIELGPNGPVAGGLIYGEAKPELLIANLHKLANFIAAGDGPADYLFSIVDKQIIASHAGYVGQKSVGYQPVAGWPCRTCGFQQACLPENCKGLET
jgi:hypothetical protein